MVNRPDDTPMPNSGSLEGRRDERMARRLDDGYRRIGDALDHGVDVAAWEAFWFDLLAEYEALFDLGDERLAA
jgi:hypothetical protein